jgi:hypothetical protein
LPFFGEKIGVYVFKTSSVYFEHKTATRSTTFLAKNIFWNKKHRSLVTLLLSLLKSAILFILIQAFLSIPVLLLRAWCISWQGRRRYCSSGEKLIPFHFCSCPQRRWDWANDTEMWRNLEGENRCYKLMRKILTEILYVPT